MTPDDNDQKKILGERVKLIRFAYSRLQDRKRPLSQVEFARICGVTKAAWNNYETGDSRISLDSAIALCRSTGATLDYIYLGKTAYLPHALAIAIETIENSRPPDGPKY